MRRILPALLCAIFTSAGAHATEVESVGITVSHADRSIVFYQDVLGFAPVEDREISGEQYEHLFGVFGMRARVVRMRLGKEFVELIDYLTPGGRPVPADSRSNDLWFQHIAIVVSDMDAAFQRLRKHHVEFTSSAPQRLPDWNPNAGGIAAFYFRDPDGNNLELISFPPGKGDPRWQQSGSDVFLGIDHTAIAISRTPRSLGFYRDGLGLRVVGESENYGREQELLNNVFGARLKITALRGDHGIGVELLEYLAPAGGRPMPRDTRADDLWHAQIQIATDVLPTLVGQTQSVGAQVVSSRIIDTPDQALGFGSAALLRDGDGHAVLVHSLDTGS
jgi:catechol 2,3-dioxygenase-like lactoylglutathione lyase family enzyme